MERLKKLLQELHLHYDFIITILGIALTILIVLLFTGMNNKYILLTAITLGGLIYIANGLKITKDPKKRNMGMSYIMFGVIIIFIGLVLVKLNIWI